LARSIRIDSKHEGVAKYGAGVLGSRLQQWPTLEACRESGYRGLVGVRSRRPASPFFRSRMTLDEAADWLAQCKASGAVEGELYVGEYLPDERVVLQGEVYRGPEGLCLYYSELKLTAREALAADGRHCHGLEAKLRLQRVLTPGDYDWLMEQLDEYADARNQGYQTSHVIEFTACDRPIGDWPGSRLIVWEIRSY
jgi:hypothetical protein